MMETVMGRNAYIIAGSLAALFIVGATVAAFMYYPMPVLQPTGQVAREQQSIIVFAAILSLAVVLPVYIMLIVFSFKYRAGRKKKTNYKPDWSENKKLEALWWGIPIVVIGILSVVTFVSSHALDPYKTLSSEQETTDINVVALRWKWLFIHPEQNIATLNYVPMRIDKPIQFNLSANAPMSSFWIPSLGSQIYVMNGMTSKVNLVGNKIGTYKGYNTNINGEGYSGMTFNAKVMDATSYDAWLAQARSSKEEFTYETFESLKKPASDQAERTYVIRDRSVVSRIIEETGTGHGAHSAPAENNSNGHSGAHHE